MKKLISSLLLAAVLWVGVVPAAFAGRMITITSLSAATATGAGTQLNLMDSKPFHTWTVVVTGSPTVVSVDLEGSIDNGTNWFTLDTSTTTTSEMRHVINKPVLSVRAKLNTLTAGAAPTVTVFIVSGD